MFERVFSDAMYSCETDTGDIVLPVRAGVYRPSPLAPQSIPAICSLTWIDCDRQMKISEANHCMRDYPSSESTTGISPILEYVYFGTVIASYFNELWLWIWDDIPYFQVAATTVQFHLSSADLSYCRHFMILANSAKISSAMLNFNQFCHKLSSSRHHVTEDSATH
jgi:hypothetical protein